MLLTMKEIIVGSGAFGTVTCCVGETVTARKYVTDYMRFNHEVNMLHTAQGIMGVMPLLGVDVRERVIRMPYFKLSLRNYATDTLRWTHPRQRIKIARRIMRRLMVIVADLHDYDIVHLDIKPENVMLEEDPATSVYRPILTDFGVSLRARTCLNSDEGVGTPGFVAPELFAKGYMVSPSADVYSLGKTLEEIVGQAGRRQDKSLADVIDKMCKKDPGQRITLKAALRHPFFRSSSLGQCFAPSI